MIRNLVANSSVQKTNWRCLYMIYYIGIDISKYKHDFCIISKAGEEIVENDFFDNTKN